MDKDIAKAKPLIRRDIVGEIPFKRTIIGEERSMPNGTIVWFITNEELQELKRILNSL